ncbi:MAG: hypothetical protein ABIJ48_12035 [Actinomycetota bacterium]
MSGGGEGLPACIDLLEEHTVATRWTVTWNGEVAREPIKGVEFRFEVMGTAGRAVLAEYLATDTSGTWPVGVLEPSDPGFKFVAMPHSGDRWTSMNITLIPVPVP